MDFQKLSFTIAVLCIALLAQIAAGAEPLYHTCTTYKNFTANSDYDRNLNILLNDLYYNTPASGYKYISVSGKNDSVYGSALCRGDISKADCQICVFEAAKVIRQICPYNIAANIWYDYCSLEYSNFNDFGYPLSTGYFIRSEFRVSSPLSSLAQIQKFLYGLSDEASASTNLFAKGITEIEGLLLLYVYGLVQCPLDLTPANCSTCIKGRIDDLSDLFDGKGAQFLSATCNVRYELYPFFKP
ncbi:antimicrobial ginkbilobin-2-like protein [Coffea arabica]|uniref:Antimicrobial ginkbilobin-2-like protein n=1 Tax=Coffea arabica TaxID=13443 RepID=A0A6P6UGK7_COFAR|nr:cysteine-rich repeat secretory protein 38-like [Coffea arabica]